MTKGQGINHDAAYVSRLHKRVELYRLILANDSIHGAEQAIEIAIKYDVRDNHELTFLVQNTVVSCYGRAFVEMKPFGAISSKWQKFKDPERARIHKNLMGQRHKNISHSDYLERKVLLFPDGFLTRGGSKVRGIAHGVKHELYNSQLNESMLKHCQQLRTSMNVKSSRLMKELYPEGSILNQPEELITAEDLIYLNSIKK
jgi:hypothetical protein